MITNPCFFEHGQVNLTMEQKLARLREGARERGAAWLTDELGPLNVKEIPEYCRKLEIPLAEGRRKLIKERTHSCNSSAFCQC